MACWERPAEKYVLGRDVPWVSRLVSLSPLLAHLVVTRLISRGSDANGVTGVRAVEARAER